MPNRPKVTFLVASPGRNEVHVVSLKLGETVSSLLERIFTEKLISEDERQWQVYIGGTPVPRDKTVVQPGDTLVLTSRRPANVSLTVESEAELHPDSRRQTFILPLGIGEAATQITLLEQAQADRMVHGLEIAGGTVKQLNGRANTGSGRWIATVNNRPAESSIFLHEGHHVHWQYQE